MPTTAPEPPDKETLARRLELLLDVVRIENGRRATYAEVEAFLAQRGLRLSRARWQYMLAADRNSVTDPVLLAAIAGFFQVPANYLTDQDGDLPERVQSQLELLQTVREQKIRVYMARMLGEVNPDRLQELNRLLGETQRPEDPGEGSSPT